MGLAAAGSDGTSEHHPPIQAILIQRSEISEHVDISLELNLHDASRRSQAGDLQRIIVLRKPPALLVRIEKAPPSHRNPPPTR